MRNWFTLKVFHFKKTSLNEWTDKHKLRKNTFKIYNWYMTPGWNESKDGKAISRESGKYEQWIFEETKTFFLVCYVGSMKTGTMFILLPQ